MKVSLGIAFVFLDCQRKIPSRELRSTHEEYLTVWLQCCNHNLFQEGHVLCTFYHKSSIPSVNLEETQVGGEAFFKMVQQENQLP